MYSTVRKAFSFLKPGANKDSRRVIARCFNYYDLSEHLRYIDTWLDCVCINDYWRENCPSDLCFYSETLGELINASYIISKERKKHKTALDLLKEKGLDTEKNLLHPALYFGHQPYGTMWEFFPRSLSRQEYINPYAAVSGFFRFQRPEKWHEDLHALLMDGLSGNGKPDEPVGSEDMSPVRKQLHKLVEAAHLIDVRETNTIAGKLPKERLYTLDKPYPEVLMTGG